MNRDRRPEQSLGRLFLDFLTFGFFTFGGGWSIVAQMQKLYIEERGVLTQEELLDLTSVSRSIPGVMVANVAMMFGYRCGGVPGGLVCLLGLSLPPFAILSLITCFYSAFRHSRWVMAAMSGIRAAVVPILFSAMAALVKGAFPCAPCAAAALLCFVLYLCFDVSCVWLVALGVLCGFLISGYQLRKEGKLP